MLLIKFGWKQASGFRGDVVWKCEQTPDAGRPDGRTDAGPTMDDGRRAVTIAHPEHMLRWAKNNLVINQYPSLLKIEKRGNFFKSGGKNIPFRGGNEAEFRQIFWRKKTHWTLSLPITTKVPYANSLAPDEKLSNLASHPDPSCLTLRQHLF